mmetsp:Transcript_80274/g.260008  ORF Transcript_80274/g.260008 Transcript_80274/m.260008 type:complete len:268 (+) Transcript_80274:756-1559(+)
MMKGSSSPMAWPSVCSKCSARRWQSSCVSTQSEANSEACTQKRQALFMTMTVASVPETYCTESRFVRPWPKDGDTWGCERMPWKSACSDGGCLLQSSWILYVAFFTGWMSLATSAKGRLNSQTTVLGSLFPEKYEAQAVTSRPEQCTVFQTRKTMGTTWGVPPGVTLSTCTEVCDRAKQLGALMATVMFSTGFLPCRVTKRPTVHCMTWPSTRPTGSSASVSSSWQASRLVGTCARMSSCSSASRVPSPCVCRMIRRRSWCSSSISS